MAGQGGKGGGAPQQPYSINDAAATGLGNALAATNYAVFAPLNDDLYMNPYTETVVDNVQDDIERQRQMAINNLGAQAQGAGAYGGSRQGVAEAMTNAEFGRMAANQLGNLRMQGYQNAMADRGQRMSAAGLLGGLSDQAFQTGRTISNDLLNQGLLQQSLQQSLIDAGRTDFGNYVGSPYSALSLPLAALGASPQPMTTTTTNDPGLFGTIGALKYAFPGMGFFG